MARFEHHANEAYRQIMAFDSSNDIVRSTSLLTYLITYLLMTLLGVRYTGDIEKCYNVMFLAVNAKCNFSVPVFQLAAVK